MSHDATKVLLGNIPSNVKEIDNMAGSIEAGLVVRLKSDGTISIDTGSYLGISVGKSLSDHARTSICRKGLKVPVLLTDAFTPTVGAQVNISDTTGKAVASGGGATAVNAVYASGVLTGIKEDGTTANVALIDFAGGL